MSNQIDENVVDDITSEELEVIQKRNLSFLNDISIDDNFSIKVSDVNILEPLTYDFIQILNNLSLKRMLESSAQ